MKAALISGTYFHVESKFFISVNYLVERGTYSELAGTIVEVTPFPLLKKENATATIILKMLLMLWLLALSIGTLCRKKNIHYVLSKFSIYGLATTVLLLILLIMSMMDTFRLMNYWPFEMSQLDDQSVLSKYYASLNAARMFKHMIYVDSVVTLLASINMVALCRYVWPAIDQMLNILQSTDSLLLSIFLTVVTWGTGVAIFGNALKSQVTEPSQGFIEMIVDMTYSPFYLEQEFILMSPTVGASAIKIIFLMVLWFFSKVFITGIYTATVVH